MNFRFRWHSAVFAELSTSTPLSLLALGAWRRIEFIVGGNIQDNRSRAQKTHVQARPNNVCRDNLDLKFVMLSNFLREMVILWQTINKL